MSTHAILPARQIDRQGRMTNNQAPRETPDAANTQGKPIDSLDHAISPDHLCGNAGRLSTWALQLIRRLRNAQSMLDRAKKQYRAELSRAISDSTSLVGVAARSLQSFPHDARIQNQLCDGVHQILAIGWEQLSRIENDLSAAANRSDSLRMIETFLRNISDGMRWEISELNVVSRSLLADAAQNSPILPLTDESSIASEALAERAYMRGRIAAGLCGSGNGGLSAEQLVSASLILDVGMLKISHEIWFHDRKLNEAERIEMQRHVKEGLSLLPRTVPEEIARLIAQHHERGSGQGYPRGLAGSAVSKAAGILAVADIYAAMISPRAYRDAAAPRIALAHVLELTERGELDSDAGWRLFQFSSYPAGTAVELQDGSRGVVIATHMAKRDTQTPHRPVVALVTDSGGETLSRPVFRDLAVDGGGGIARTLMGAERQSAVGRFFPSV